MAGHILDVITIGSGITGLTAARLAAQRGLATAAIEALLFGGLVMNINKLDQWPEGEDMSGATLASMLMMEAMELGVESISATVTGLKREEGVVAVETDAGIHRARAVIVASGAKLRKLGVPGEAQLEHRGVSQCADCDGPLYKGKDVVVVGGGDSSLQEALVLAEFCERVHLVNRGPAFRARRDLVDAIAAKANITPVWNAVVEEVAGRESVEHVRLRHVSTGECSSIACAGVFAYIGLEPNCAFVPPEAQRDSLGYLLTDTSFRTTMDGVFAAGAVRAGFSGLLTDAIADAEGAVAAAAASLGSP